MPEAACWFLTPDRFVQEAVITDEHPSSSDGGPVVVTPDGAVLGPGDIPGEVNVSGTTKVAYELRDAARRAGFRVVGGGAS